MMMAILVSWQNQIDILSVEASLYGQIDRKTSVILELSFQLKIIGKLGSLQLKLMLIFGLCLTTIYQYSIKINL